MVTLRFAIAPGLVAAAVLTSCSGEVPNSDPVSGAPGAGGGANGAGGTTSNGGTTGPASGAPGSSGNAAGGATSQTTGGAPGGGPSAGGAVASQGGATGTTGGVGVSGSAGTPGSNGGTTSGGTSAGGTAPGGSNSGGKSQGSGGTATTGGASSGGTAGASGASTTGGMSAGGAGACVPATCGSHKWPCWKMPNPPTSPAAVPNHQSYADLGNGAVLDNITCLVWEKANPAPVPEKGNWQDNFNRCAALGTSNYAGFNDWRMPTRVEMASITDVTLGATGYPKIFTVTGGYYLTGSFWYKTILTATGSTPEDRVWGYGKNGFTSNAIIRSNLGNVTRCVRGNGSGEAAGTYAMAPANHYTVTSGVVTDNYTGLSWQQTFSSGRMAWSAAATYCSSQTTGGLSGWRVPTLNELASTVNEALVAPAIDRTAFPNTIGGCGQTDWYWAAEASKVGGTAWGISYCDGYTGWNAASAEWNTFPDAYVRCVR